MNLTLSTVFTKPHRFLVVIFSFVSMHVLIFFLISSMICWLFRSVLFSLHMSVFLVFFSCSWHNHTALWSEKMLEMISFCLNLPRLGLWPRMWSILEKVLCALRKRWNSLFWGEMSYRYQLGLTGPFYHLKIVSPC